MLLSQSAENQPKNLFELSPEISPSKSAGELRNASGNDGDALRIHRVVPLLEAAAFDAWLQVTRAVSENWINAQQSEKLVA